MSVNEYLMKARHDDRLRSAARYRLAAQAKRACAAQRQNAAQREKGSAPLRLLRGLSRLVNA